WVDLLHEDGSRPGMLAQRHAEPVQPREQGVRALVEDEERRAHAALGGARTEERRDRGLARARSALDQRARAALDSAAEEVVEPRDPALHAPARRLAAMLGRDEARKDLQPAAIDRVVV